MRKPVIATLIAGAFLSLNAQAINLLQGILDEEKAADKKLSSLAEGGINQDAADAAHSEDEEEDEDAAARGRKGGSASAVATRRRR